jgi:hypothetical protein
MSKGLGKVQSLVLSYLDQKAKLSRVTTFNTVEPYATTTEISANLKVRLDTVCQAVESLVAQKKIRVYPNGRKRNRFFGSLILPSISEKEILLVSKMLLKK